MIAIKYNGTNIDEICNALSITRSQVFKCANDSLDILIHTNIDFTERYDHIRLNEWIVCDEIHGMTIYTEAEIARWREVLNERA